MPHHAIPPYDDEPDHMIIWLDQYIGDPTKYKQLKKAFFTQSDPKNETPVQLFETDLATILAEGPTPIKFEGVVFLLAAFTNVEDCIRCFEQNHKRRIFFITSSSLGHLAVPAIIERFKETFIDNVTNESYMFIYIFCLDKMLAASWALEYRDYVHIFDFEGDLLSRLIRDIGDYFLTQGKRLVDESPPNNAAAYHRLFWAHELYQRYGKIENVFMRKELEEVNEILQQVEDELNLSSDEDK